MAQTKLSEVNDSNKAIAHELAKKQRDISVSQFFEKNRHLLGFDNKKKALMTTIKEAVDNSLDACEEARILPEVSVEVIDMGNDRFRVIIEDNGPGIVKKQIPNIFAKLLYGSKFHSMKQQRGQQGIGISAAVLYAQLTTGRPAKIVSKIHPKEPAHYYELHINTNENKPEIVKEDQLEWNKEHGTKIEIDLEASYQSGNQSIDEYLKETSIVNPHATIIYTNPKAEQIIFPRATQDLPAQAMEIKPHPYGVELGMMIHMLKDTEARTLQSFLSTEFTRVGSGTAKLICENSALLPNTKPKEITREQAEKLFQGIQKTKLIAPPTDCISPIGQELLERGLKKEVNAEFYATTTRQPAVYRGNPFVIEAGIAYGGQQPAEESIRVMRFANRVPLLYQHGACAVTKSIVQTAWRNYGMSQSRGALPIGPCTVIVHIASVWVPFTSESKEAIAHYPEIIKEIKLALQDCGRQLASYVNKKKRIHAESAKRDYIETFIPHVSDALKTLIGFKDDEKEKVEKYLREILEKHRGQLEDIDFDPTKNVEYDEEMAKIGKSSEDIEDVHVEEEVKKSKKKKDEESDE
ncbi:DNA topoisomerase VI subunit B [Candidatus Woesearchaeota archaeon]|nr:DNA topoisomerase VI subunit B [Candidatus Woesearchaeota archaeon]